MEFLPSPYLHHNRKCLPEETMNSVFLFSSSFKTNYFSLFLFNLDINFIELPRLRILLWIKTPLIYICCSLKSLFLSSLVFTFFLFKTETVDGIWLCGTWGKSERQQPNKNRLLSGKSVNIKHIQRGQHCNHTRFIM